MATASIILPIPPAGFDAVVPAALEFVGGTEGQNHHWQVLFDDSDAEYCYWQFQMPANYASAPVFHFTFSMASANTADDVQIQVSIGAIADGEAMAGDAFDTPNGATITVDDTAGDLNVESIALANADSVAANELVLLRFTRLGDAGPDTAAGDLQLLSARLDYTTT